MAGLNLPWYSKSEGSKTRITAARKRANKLAAEIIASISDVPDPAELNNVMDDMLASGTIKSLKEASQVAGTPNPTPTKAEAEAVLNRSGVALVNGKNLFKIKDGSSNVEAFRMLYMAGMSVDDIRSVMDSLTTGTAYVLKADKYIVKTTLDEDELHERYNFYPEYFVSTGSSNYLVLDRAGGSEAQYAVVCEQDDGTESMLTATPSFPVKGELSYEYNGVKGSVRLNLQDGDDVRVQMGDLPFSVTYDRVLKIKSSKRLAFFRSDAAVALGLKDALVGAYKVMSAGYSGYYDTGYGDYPFNVGLAVPSYSKSNARKIFSSLVEQGFSKELALKYISGDSLYEGVDELIAVAGSDTSDKELTSRRVDSLFRAVNVRIEATSMDAIAILKSLPDSDLEYLLGKRMDIRGIEPSATTDECLRIMESKFSSNASYTNASQLPSDVWKSNTSMSRMAYVLTYEMNVSEEVAETRNAREALDEFLNSVDAVLGYSTELYSTEYSTSETALGMEFACSADLTVVYSVQGGFRAIANANIEGDLPDWYYDLLDDCAVIEAYMSAALSAFNAIVDRVAAVIRMLNSSISVASGTGSASLGVGSILQCSLSISASLVLPPFLSFLNLALKAVISVLAEIVAGIKALVDGILCPIQNLLDKYLNTSNFVLPCKINYSVPVISGISGYLGAYLSAFNGLKALCDQVSKDATWLTFKASQAAGSVQLLVTNSADCKES